MAPRLKYFVPQGHEEKLRERGLSFTPAIAETADRDGPSFRLHGVIITSPANRAEAALKALEFKDFIECRIGNQLYRLAVGHTDSLATFADYRSVAPLEWQLMEEYLTGATFDLASWINRPVDLRVAGGHPVVPSGTAERLLVVLDGRPPGEPAQTHISRTCDIDLESLAYVTEYTAGVGTLVRDGETVIGQVVGHTLYVYLKLWDHALLFIGIRGANLRLYERMLALVWNAYSLNAPTDAASPASSPEELDTAMLEWSADVYANSHLIVEQKRRALEQIEEQHQEAMLEYRAALLVYRAIEAFPDHVQEYLGQAPERKAAWASLAKHPLVRSVSIVENGINVSTMPIVLEHEGRRHPLGSFVLRITTDGSLYVWCVDSPHPKRIPHPHIGETGQLCYGNMALTIERLATIERNFPKIFRIALELLSEGYDPTTTFHPITEWPEETDESDHEPLAPESPVRSSDGSIGDADRGGVGGELDRVPAR